MICYVCHANAHEEPDITTLFARRVPLCGACRTSLTAWREGKRCSFCHRLMQESEDGCMDCEVLAQRFRPPGRIICLLDYNEPVKMLFHRYKFVGDCALAEVLAMFLDHRFREYDVIIPVPISPGRMAERRYNQTTMVLDRKGIGYEEVLITDKVKRQSELGKAERLRGENPFKIGTPNPELGGKRILVVDDIYTTGVTVHQAMEELYTFSPATIDVLTFSKA